VGVGGEGWLEIEFIHGASEIAAVAKDVLGNILLT
jgi:hypothetical protein